MERRQKRRRGEREVGRPINSLTTPNTISPQLLAVAAVASAAQAEEDLMALATAKSIVETRATVADRVRSRRAVAQASQTAHIAQLAQRPTQDIGVASEGEIGEATTVATDAYEDIYEDEDEYMYEDDGIAAASLFAHEDDGQAQGETTQDSRRGVFAQLLAEAKEEVDAKGGLGLEAKLAEANDDEPRTGYVGQRSSKIKQVQELCACTEVMASHFLESTGWNVEFAVETFFSASENSPARAQEDEEEQEGGRQEERNEKVAARGTNSGDLDEGQRHRQRQAGEEETKKRKQSAKQERRRRQAQREREREPISTTSSRSKTRQNRIAAGTGVNAVRARSTSSLARSQSGAPVRLPNTKSSGRSNHALPRVGRARGASKRSPRGAGAARSGVRAARSGAGAARSRAGAAKTARASPGKDGKK